MRYRYDPDNPLANERGMVTIDDYYAYKSLEYNDKRMFVGNQPVVLNYISDGMNDTRHMADGKIYDSKSKFRKVTKRAGCVEVGNNSEGLKRKKYIAPTDRRELRENIKQSIQQLERKELPEKDLHLIKDHSMKVDWVNRNRTRKLHQKK